MNTLQHNKSGILIILLALCLSFPVRGQYDFSASEITGNAPLRVKFHFISTASVDTISSYYWDFGNGQSSTLDSPDSVTYDTPGTYSPSLMYNNRVDLMIVKPDYITVQAAMEEIIVPNVFTPNDDPYNNTLIVTNNTGLPLKMNIFTRAGILVFKTEGTEPTWDGYTASGQKLNPGIYFYTIEAITGDPNKKYSKTGFLYIYW